MLRAAISPRLMMCRSDLRAANAKCKMQKVLVLTTGSSTEHFLHLSFCICILHFDFLQKRQFERVITCTELLPHHLEVPHHPQPLASADAAPTRTVKMSVGFSIRRGMDFLVNGERHHHDRPVKVGDLQVWDVVNSSLMDHPFHLHGFFFQVLSVNGKAPAFRSWEDVVNLPPRSTVRIAWMPEDRPGSWMYHCHILEHHEAGMMGHFEVVR